MSKEKLVEHLQAIGGLSSLLNDLRWKTKQSVFLALFKELSVEHVYNSLLEILHDRRLERQEEQKKDSSTLERRNSEKSFRAEFIQRVAKGLADLGAPVSLNWEQLLSNPDSCCQAFRLMLTRIKSLQRIRPPSARSERSDSSITPRKSREIHRARTFRDEADEERPPWNSGVEESVYIEQEESVSSERYGGANMSIEKIPLPVPRVSSSNSKTSKRMQQELDDLKIQNSKLQKRLEEAEGMYNALVASQKNEPASFNEKRVNFLKAQNLQLQRQLDLSLDAVTAQQDAKVSFRGIVQSLSELVENAKEEAAAAGAEAPSKKTWLMAVPTKLIDEIQELDNRLDQLTRSAGRHLHQSLHIDSCKDKESFLSTSATTLHVHGHGYSDDISPVSHLRFDRLLELEGSLATTASQLLRFSHDATERCFLPLAVDKSAVPPKELSLSARDLAQKVRRLANDCSQLGAVVCSQSVGPGAHVLSSGRLLEILSPFSGHYRANEREIRSLLKRMDAESSDLTVRLESCQHELELWHRAYAQQYKAIHGLVNGLKKLWEKKFSWIQEELTEPLECFVEVIDDYKGSDQSSSAAVDHFNFFIETFDKHKETLLKSQEYYKRWVESLHSKLCQIIEQYNRSSEVMSDELLAFTQPRREKKDI